MREGIALVLSAPSGAGKTTLIKRLLSEFPHFGYSVSCTTRAPREGEIDGKDYTFLARPEFERLRAAKMLIEGKTYNEIIAATNISSATLSRISRSLQYGNGYSKFLK